MNTWNLKRNIYVKPRKLLSICLVGLLSIRGGYANANDVVSEDSKPFLVFISSEATSGDLGGLSGADMRCQTEAKAASLTGTYRAWLSDSSQNVGRRFENAGTTRPFMQVGGAKIADNWKDLIAGELDAPITTSARGTSGLLGLVWTGTELDGTGAADVANCNDWQKLDGDGRTGTNIKRMGVGWSQFGAFGCRMGGFLYCFQTTE